MLPFVRASGSDRVVHSALNWTAGKSEMRFVSTPTVTRRPGFAFASDYNYAPVLSLIVDQTVS